MGYFSDYLKRTDHRAVTKWRHYFSIYERELSRFRGRDISFLEIGVFHGGSIPMWAGYFGKQARLSFVDIDPTCRDHAEPGTHVEIGDQADPVFLAELAEKHGPFDVVIDDGGHSRPVLGVGRLQEVVVGPLHELRLPAHVPWLPAVAARASSHSRRTAACGPLSTASL